MEMGSSSNKCGSGAGSGEDVGSSEVLERGD